MHTSSSVEKLISNNTRKINSNSLNNILKRNKNYNSNKTSTMKTLTTVILILKVKQLKTLKPTIHNKTIVIHGGYINCFV